MRAVQTQAAAGCKQRQWIKRQYSTAQPLGRTDGMTQKRAFRLPFGLAAIRRSFMSSEAAAEKYASAEPRAALERSCSLRWKKVTLAATILAVSTAAGSPSFSEAVDKVPDDRSVQRILDHQVERYLADPCRVGVSISARIGRRTFFANGGWADRRRRIQPTPDSIYELASVTKTFIGALAAGALVDRLVSLDGDFRVHLPGQYPNLARAGRPITLRTLATHTSGLQRDLPSSDTILSSPDYSHIGDQFAELNKAYTRSGDLASLRKVSLRSTPGSKFVYSNLGMRVLGYGLEQVYETPLPALLARRVLDPLRMQSTGFEVTSADRRRLVTPYNRLGQVQPYHDASAGAGYGLYSTPRDMARYTAWLLTVRDDVVKQAHRLIRGNKRTGEALIWNVGTIDGGRVLWHGGGTFGSTSQVVLFPEAEQGYVLLANDACEGSEATLKAMAIAIQAGLRSKRQRTR
jgi:D-alanyl-D-alanine-carboxypeptidase/D-alanyl-D-alanine-endopeptidase